MAKKGGFAVSTSLSFGFFLLYYVLLIGGEELADRNQVSPEMGMWAPNLVLLILALYLILHTIRERAPISILSFLKKKDLQVDTR
jgi:lipopolysaccharide export system permease protein